MYISIIYTIFNLLNIIEKAGKEVIKFIHLLIFIENTKIAVIINKNYYNDYNELNIKKGI